MKAVTDLSAKPFAILCAIDYSPASDAAFAAACRMAARVRPSVLHIVHVFAPHKGLQAAFDTAGAMSPEVTGEVLHAEKQLDDHCRGLAKDLGVPLHSHLLVGNEAEMVGRLAGELDVDLVFVGTRERSRVARAVFGSVADAVCHEAPCPVVVVREGTPLTPVVEPPCPDCVAVRIETAGARLWCARHSEHHPRAHTYGEMPQGFGGGSSLIGLSGR